MPTKSGIIGTVKLKMKDGTFLDLPNSTPLEEITTFAEQYEFVRVVRCKDCRWYEIYKLKKDGTEDRRCKREFCALHSRKFPDDYYCADGERRGEE